MSVFIPNATLFLKTDKKTKDGKMPLYIRFPRIDGKEPKFSLGKKGTPLKFSKEEWDNDNKRPYDASLEIIVSDEVNRIKSAIIDAVRHKEEITIDLLRKIVENEVVDTTGNASFYDYFKKYQRYKTKKEICLWVL